MDDQVASVSTPEEDAEDNRPVNRTGAAGLQGTETRSGGDGVVSRASGSSHSVADYDNGSPGWYIEDPDTGDPEADETRESSSGVLTRVSLGGALLAIDAINERLEQVDDSHEEVQESRTIESVLVPEDEWEARFGQAPGLAARHLAIGVAIDTKSKVNRTLEILNNMGNAAVRTLEIVLEPITKSRFYRPVRKRIDTAVQRGENQMNYWMNLGRSEDVRSRELAETTLSQVMDESMDELVDNERVQEFVQEMLAAQSLGIIDEAIEEIRERAFSSDVFFERPFRRMFRRPYRRTIPGPSFDRRLVRPMSKRTMPIARDSHLGYYAGFTSRMLALAIDVGLVILFMAMTGWIFQTIGRFLGETSWVDSLSLTSETLSAIGVAFTSLNATTVVIAYAFIFWILTGQTPGMMLMGLRVVSTDGGRLTFWRAILRLVGYVVSFAALFIGFFWVLADDHRQGWHDKLGKTYVVYSWDAHPDETFLTTFM